LKNKDVGRITGLDLTMAWVPTFSGEQVNTLCHAGDQGKKVRWKHMQLRYVERVHRGGIQVSECEGIHAQGGR